ncbi:Amino acid permease [Planctomycetes bacterium Pan216]|uniref:Amino acid permease n=1 Tax=Kolteria novifilia TaxID=2527975 RepID=A0A518BA30_9BACT|nr:Amino acid permease [Planctomycetes bacterium Pan216]
MTRPKEATTIASGAKRPAKNAAKASATKRFGTFGGVFTPCTLTILGVILFLRFGEVVGNAGILQSFLVVLISVAITSLTAISLSAVATNTRVRGGGVYYLVSRSLGVEFGGAIGLTFFGAQAVSVSMYVVGFTEAFMAAFPTINLPVWLIGSLVNLGVFACVYVGAGWTIKIQYGILAALVLSLLSFFAGALPSASWGQFVENLGPDYRTGSSFFSMFALFFPAATGIMAGANMSGDLRDPGKSIPVGTLGAIGTTSIIYLLMALMLGASASRSSLLDDPLIVKDLSFWPLLVTVGVFAATLSSALSSMMGAPRILQALARDQIFARLRTFATGSGESNEPRPAIILTAIISGLGVLAGSLDTIAPIITMCFMITYGYLNLATFYEAYTGNPSYRPTFRFSHWSTALAGTVSCVVVMFLVSPFWAILSIIGISVLQWYIARKKIEAAWGDVQSGTVFERTRLNLLRLEEDLYHPKNWRPSILALSGGAWTRPHLAVYGQWLTGGCGILTLAQIIAGEVDSRLERRASQEEALRSFIRDKELEAFPAVLVAPSLTVGIEALVQCYGIGALRPNLILMGWSSDVDRMNSIAGALRTVARLGRSIVIVRYRETTADPWVAPMGTIDVWWRGKANGHLLILLAYLFAQNDAWRGRPIRLLRMISSEAGREEATRHLESLLGDARIRATPVVVVADDFLSTIRHVSGGAAVVFLGFAPPEQGEELTFFHHTNDLMEDLPTVISVWSAGDSHLEA